MSLLKRKKSQETYRDGQPSGSGSVGAVTTKEWQGELGGWGCPSSCRWWEALVSAHVLELTEMDVRRGQKGYANSEKVTHQSRGKLLQVWKRFLIRVLTAMESASSVWNRELASV